MTKIIMAIETIDKEEMWITIRGIIEVTTDPVEIEIMIEVMIEVMTEVMTEIMTEIETTMTEDNIKEEIEIMMIEDRVEEDRVEEESKEMCENNTTK